MKGDSSQSDTITVCVSFTLQSEEFPLFAFSDEATQRSPALRDEIPTAAREPFRRGFSSGWHEGPLPVLHPPQHAAHWA